MINIFEMSRSKRDIENNLYSKVKSYEMHLIKIFCHYNSSYFDHWCDEVYSYYSNIDKLKGSNKFPSANMIYKCIHGHREDIIDNVIRSDIKFINRKYPDLTFINISDELVMDIKIFIKLISGYISKELSLNGVLDINELVDEIRNYLKNYYNFNKI